MKSILLLSVAGLLFGAPAAAAQKADEPDLQKSIVRIIVPQRRFASPAQPWLKRTLPGGTGTGFIVSGNRIVTNAHVVAYATQIEFEPYDSKRRIEATIEKISPEFDLALLKLTNKADEALFKNRPPIALSHTCGTS